MGKADAQAEGINDYLSGKPVDRTINIASDMRILDICSEVGFLSVARLNRNFINQDVPAGKPPGT